MPGENAENESREREEKKEKKEKKKSVTQTVRELAEPLCEELGLKLWDVTYGKEGAEWYLRIYIDKPGGVSIEDCVDLTHAVDPILDREDPIQREYTLEVSSPGLNRRLIRPEHFEAFLNYPVRVKLLRPMENGVRELEGILTGIEANGDFQVLTEETTEASFTAGECASVILLDDDFEADLAAGFPEEEPEEEYEEEKPGSGKF